MTDYEKGQRDLIDYIKQRIDEIADKSEPEDILFDVMDLLKTLKITDCDD